MDDRIRLAIVDDHPLLRQGLRWSFAQEPDLVVVAEACDAAEAARLFSMTAIDVAVIDFGLPGPNGVAVARELLRRQPECKILALSMVTRVGRVVEFLRAGARGFALKSQSAAELVEAVRTVARGGCYLAPQLPAAEIGTMLLGEAHDPLASLSSREREIFDLIVRGHTNADIGTSLYIALRTVETHRQNIMRKLGMGSAVELVRFAAAHDLLDD